MQNFLLKNLSELARKRAVLIREEAQLWDILARDLKREAARLDEVPVRRTPHVREPLQSVPVQPDVDKKLYVRISEAARMMGIGRSSLYNEINAARIEVRKAGRKTLIAVSDIHAWFRNLPEN